MENEMIERVARAIQASIQRRDLIQSGSGVAYTDDDNMWKQAWSHPDTREAFSRQARAAIEALTLDDLKDLKRAMIDAALSKPVGGV